jgi:hypothetical protein
VCTPVDRWQTMPRRMEALRTNKLLTENYTGDEDTWREKNG